LPYSVACTVNSRPSLGATKRPSERKKKEKELLVLPKLGCLIIYISAEAMAQRNVVV